MFRIEIIKREFNFSFPATTSRGTLEKKTSWFIKLTDNEKPGIYGLGECSPIWGLSPEVPETYEQKLHDLTKHAEQYDHYLRAGLIDYPSIRFGLETALLDFMHGGKRILFPREFILGKQAIKINGLIWMNSPEKALIAARKKIEQGFSCIKLKIGSYDWDIEEEIIKTIRKEHGNGLEIRVDANGAYATDEAKKVMERCAQYQVHSIEQPIKPGRWKEMNELVNEKSTPVALDEELIGLPSESMRLKMLEAINPSYLVIKPSLVGGLSASREWINLAEKNSCKWWMTSMLESNIGLNAISQFVSTLPVTLAQGLGTGKIYENNIHSPLEIKGEFLNYNPAAAWETI